MNKMLSHFKNKYYKKVLKTAGISLLMLSCIGLYAGEDTDIVVAGSNNIVNCNIIIYKQIFIWDLEIARIPHFVNVNI